MTHKLINEKKTLKGRVVGHPGDVVRIVGSHAEVVIVENAKGQRFSIKMKELKET